MSLRAVLVPKPNAPRRGADVPAPAIVGAGGAGWPGSHRLRSGERLSRLLALLCMAGLLVLAGCAPLAPRSTPIPDAPIDLVGRCNQTEEDGFHERAQLDVRANQVQSLFWRIDIGRKGHCQFDLDRFRQVQARPSIELIERSGGSCKLMVWQGQGRVTLAHAGCERYCTAGIYEQAWPVMFDASTGVCARVR